MTVKLLKNSRVEAEGKPIFSNFPDGQPHLKLGLFQNTIDFNRAEVHCSLRGPNDLFNLGLLLDILFQEDSIMELGKVNIYIYWLFGARMDRRIDRCQPKTISVVDNILRSYATNLLVRAEYHLLDIHSGKGLNIIEYKDISLSPIIKKVLEDFGPCDIYFPDAGAKDRYKNLFLEFNILCGRKKRDSETGRLSGFELESGSQKHENILIVDDICDGGGTFIGQYEIIKSLGYKRVGLYTTHGLYTKGTGILSNFDEIYSTNSYSMGLPLDENNLPTNNCLKWCKLNKENGEFINFPLD